MVELSEMLCNNFRMFRMYAWPTNAFILEYLYNLSNAKHTRAKEDIRGVNLLAVQI